MSSLVWVSSIISVGAVIVVTLVLVVLIIRVGVAMLVGSIALVAVATIIILVLWATRHVLVCMKSLSSVMVCQSLLVLSGTAPYDIHLHLLLGWPKGPPGTENIHLD